MAAGRSTISMPLRPAPMQATPVAAADAES
eukprot:COSAG01_NODE_32271_length_583_cov_63.652893_2_plen_29_part_01